MFIFLAFVLIVPLFTGLFSSRTSFVYVLGCCDVLKLQRGRLDRVGKGNRNENEKRSMSESENKTRARMEMGTRTAIRTEMKMKTETETRTRTERKTQI